MKSRMVVWERMIVSVLLAYPRDPVAHWELWLTATAQHHEEESHQVSLTQEKMEIQNSK